VYDEAHRGVAYLRWQEGDAQLFIPSLYPHRPRRSSTAVVQRADSDAIEASTDSDPTSALAPVSIVQPELAAANT
jgi:hypothetical protein